MRERGVFDRLAALVGEEDPEVVYECRACGTTLDADAEQCPECESAEIERFVI